MRDVSSATWTSVEPVSLSCVLYPWTMDSFSLFCRATGLALVPSLCELRKILAYGTYVFNGNEVSRGAPAVRQDALGALAGPFGSAASGAKSV